jgi:hypothetical protein
LGMEDVYDLLEILSIDAFNRAVMRKHEERG